MGRKVVTPSVVNPYEDDAIENGATSGRGCGSGVRNCDFSQQARGAMRDCGVRNMLQTPPHGGLLKSALKQQTKEAPPTSGALEASFDLAPSHKNANATKLVRGFENKKEVTSVKLVSKDTCKAHGDDVEKVAGGRSVTFQASPPQLVEDFPAETATPSKRAQLIVETDFVERNPFRVQTFEAFCGSPDHSVPPNCRIDEADLEAWANFPRATEGLFLDRFLQEMSLANVGGNSTSANSLVDAALMEMMESGEWFYKWTRHGKVHKRYFRLDVQRGLFIWGPRKQTPPFLHSHVDLDDVLNLRPDCMTDKQSGRIFYRFFLVTEKRTFIFATEVRNKFDMWYNALTQITLMCCHAQLQSLLDASALSSRKTLFSRVGPSRVISNGYGNSAVAATNDVSALVDMRGKVLSSD